VKTTPNDVDPGRTTTIRSRRLGLSIQSKLLIMLLVTSLLTAVVVGVIGYLNGRDSLRDAAFDQLTTIRELRTEEIQRDISSLQRGVRLDSRNASAVEGATALIDGFAQLQNSTITAEQEAALLAFYTDAFVPALESRSGLDFAPEAFVPATPAGRYLQSYYVADRPWDDYDTGLALSDAEDGSAWSAANAEYGPYFTGLVDELGYEDVLLLDREGNVAYSAYKSVDLGVNMTEEPYTDSALTLAFREAVRTGSLNVVVTTDFERYLPSLNVPTAWVVSPIGSATDVIGALAVQIPITQINSVMTGDRKWADQGLGETGEVYLVGEDKLMRSESRLLVEHPDTYVETVVRNGTPTATAERIVEVGGTVQLQPVDFFAADRALKGQTGTALAAEYTDANSLVAYAPLEIEGLNWGIVAHIDEAEAFAPVNEFMRNILLSTLAILLVVSLLSLVLAQVFTRPVKRLVDAVRRVSGGDLAVQVPQGSRDPAAKPLRLLRNWVIPFAALFALLAFAARSEAEQVWPRVVATILGFLVILLLLSSFNVALFTNAKDGSWRKRIPGIFIEIARLILVVVGLAFLFQWVWGADVGGLIAALGVTSIVIGLALQNAVGGVISGLLLLFEQPFKIGDWLDVGGVSGRVIEVNWRACHIDTGSGIQIVPNSTLSGASFKNLSQPAGAFNMTTTVAFTTDDPPHEVAELLVDIADALPMRVEGQRATVVYTGAGKYAVEIPIQAASLETAAISTYLAWLWYAARRRGLALDGDSTDPIAAPEQLAQSLLVVGPTLHAGEPEREALLTTARLVRYGAGEIIHPAGVVPRHIHFIVSGHVDISVEASGGRVDVTTNGPGDYIGQSALTREPTLTVATAADVTTLLEVPVTTIDDLVRARPLLAKEIGQSLELKRKLANDALSAVGMTTLRVPENAHAE